MGKQVGAVLDTYEEYQKYPDTTQRVEDRPPKTLPSLSPLPVFTYASHPVRRLLTSIDKTFIIWIGDIYLTHKK